MWELVCILRYHYVNARRRIINITDLQYLHVVSSHITGQREWRHVNDVYVGIAHGKQTCDLCVFPLQEFFHGYAFHFLHGHRVDMYFDASPALDVLPLLLKLLLHLSPEHQRLMINLLYLGFGLLLKEEKAETSLYNGGLLH